MKIRTGRKGGSEMTQAKKSADVKGKLNPYCGVNQSTYPICTDDCAKNGHRLPAKESR